MAAHRIRLNSAWDIGVGSADGEVLYRASKTQLTAHAGQGFDLAESETLVLRRRFHSPSNLQPSQRVVLRISGCSVIARFILNGSRLLAVPETLPSADQPLVLDITDRLSADNELIIQVPGGAASNPNATLFEEVCLVISDSDSGHRE